jgi:hypothetical protein
MTGPQHYQEAERLIAFVPKAGHAEKGILLAEAQVHATLAGVALGALGPDREHEAWRDAAGTAR